MRGRIIIGLLAAAALLAPTGAAAEPLDADETVTDPTDTPATNTIAQAFTYEYEARDGRVLTYDGFLPDTGAAAPLVVYLHGGAWGGGNSAVRLEQSQFFARRGYAVLNVNYRLVSATDSTAKHPVLVQDVVDALQSFALEEAFGAVDASRTFLVGDSAGGHLATLLAVGPWRAELTDYTVLGAAAISGVYDLPTAVAASPTAFPAGPTVALAALAYVGCHAEALNPVELPFCLGKLAFGSPVTHLSADDPALALVHDRSDPVVAYAQQVEIANAARAVGLDVATLTVDGPDVCTARDVQVPVPGRCTHGVKTKEGDRPTWPYAREFLIRWLASF